MTGLLEEAFSKAKELTESEQDQIARQLLDEIESDRKWDELFAKTPEKLRKLADAAWLEHEAGHSEPLDPDKL